MKKLLIAISALFLFFASYGQQLPLDNQYILNTYSINPAFAGENGNIEAFLGYRASWVGVEGAPTLASVNLNAALGKTMGLGLSVKSESAGSFQHVYGSLAYAYHLQLGPDMYASLGLEAMLYRNQIDNTKILSQGLDPLVENAAALNGTSFDAGAGLGFWAKGFTFGASAQRLIGSKIVYDGERSDASSSYFYKTDMQINGFLSYMITSGGGKRRRRRSAPTLRIEPLVAIRYTAGQVFYDGAVNVMFKDRIWGGAMYRTDGSIGIHLGGALQERIIMTYAYEFGMGDGIAAQSSGTHEISIGFRLKAADRRSKRGRSLFLLETPRAGSSTAPATTPENYKPADDKKLQAYVDTTTSLKKTIAANEEKIKKLQEDMADLATRLETAAEDAVAAKFGPPFIIRNIKFGYNSDRLFPSSFPELNKLAKKLKDNAKWDIKISGHTDNTGSPSYNKRLSKRRAESVKRYLMSQGVTENRILTEGMGQTKPLPGLDPSSKQGRAANRRIEGRFRKNK